MKNVNFSLIFFQIVLSSVIKFQSIKSLPSNLQIGAIFFDGEINSPSEFAFKYAVHRINHNSGILPKTTLTYNIQYVTKNNSFCAGRKVCGQISSNIHAIFGPNDAELGTHIHSICGALDIPHLETRIDIDMIPKESSINLYPAQSYVNEAFLDVIDYFNWTKIGILHEFNYGIIQLRKLIRKPSLEVHVRQVDANTYVRILQEFKDKKVHSIILDTNPGNISNLLKGILQLQMNQYKYHYIFTNFDIETFDLEDFKYNFVNITSFRLVDVNDVGVKEILKDMELFKKKTFKSSSQMYANKLNYIGPNGNILIQDETVRKLRTIKTYPALIFDSVYIFAIGLQTLSQSHVLRVANLSCQDENPWDAGLSLINYINSVEWMGLTGPIQFKEGRRVQFKLDLVKLKQHSIVKVGEWSPETRLNITNQSEFFDSGTMNVTLVVITILETPYVMMHYGKNFTGNERFYGFCVDILNLIAHEVGFDYILDLVPDRKYGAKDPISGEWNGMVAQLMKYKADLAVGSMTITYARESVIDFTKPFMNLGIGILLKVPSSSTKRLFSFMNPLAFEIWIYVLAAYFFVSLTIYLVANFSSFQWHNLIKAPILHADPATDANFHNITCTTCGEIRILSNRELRQTTVNSVKLSNQFSIANSFWFTIGTLMQQGSDVNPKALSTRIVSAFWWFFTLIIIASYTANLAAFLTVERMITPIKNADDLASQTEISYGTLESGSTMTFFRDSMIETYKKMWRNMDKKQPSAFTSTYEEGINRVNEGNYAFLMESTMLDYTVHRNCNLTQIGGLLDAKGYGIATPKGSPWRNKLSLAILELQEKGDIQMLYDKWWKNTNETCSRKSDSKQSKANALNLDNIGGVFVVLLVGMAIAICVAVFEFWQHQNQIKLNEQEQRQPKQLFNKLDRSQLPTQQRSFCVELFEELRYALHCMDSRKRPSLKRLCPKCYLENYAVDHLLTSQNNQRRTYFENRIVSTNQKCLSNSDIEIEK